MTPINMMPSTSKIATMPPTWSEERRLLRIVSIFHAPSAVNVRPVNV